MFDLKLMVVEDDPTLLKSLERILKREVSTVKSYGLPSDALNDLNNFVPDLILTDIKMPGMTGLEMVKIIRQTFPDVPVIIASAFSDPELFKSAIKLKVENYVVKPIDVEELLRTIAVTADHIQTKKLLIEKESLLDQYKHIVDLSANISITDKKGVITYVNDKFCHLSGYTREELMGRTHNIMRHPNMSKEFYRDLWRQILKKQVWQGIIKNRRKDGSAFYGDTTIAPILDADGEISEFIAIKIDISDLLMSKKQLQRDIVTDRLTGLPNRIQLQADLHAIDEYTMLLVDIDRFKEMNLLFGIHLGDVALEYVGDAIKTVFNAKDVSVYRVASDEFVVLGQGDLRETFKEKVDTLKERMEKSPLEYEHVSFEIDFSCAVVHTNAADFNPIEQLQSTVSEAKRTKRLFLEHDADGMLQKQYEENFEWTKKIKSGLNDGRVIVYFQPIYDIQSNAVIKFESLVRLIDEDGSIVPPFKFLNAAKRSRYYRELTHTVIRQACSTFIGTAYNFSINFSIEDLTDEETLQFLIDTVKESKLEGRIIVEVLESEGIDNFDTIQNVFERLRQGGIRIAIDDFGSGYSNFAYLVKLPVSLLKIDGSLIKNIVHDNSARIIVQSIVMFAHELGMKVVAEFVSEEAILEVIKSLGVDFAQGYYIGMPERQINDTFTYDKQ